MDGVISKRHGLDVLQDAYLHIAYGMTDNRRTAIFGNFAELYARFNRAGDSAFMNGYSMPQIAVQLERNIRL